MRKLALLVAFFVISFNLTSLAASRTTPPDNILYFGASVFKGEVSFNTIGSFVKPRKNMKVYKTPEFSSEVIDTLRSGEAGCVMSAKAIYPIAKRKVMIASMVPEINNKTIARDNPGRSIPRPGDYIYLIRPRAEGFYEAYYEGFVINVPIEGISGLTQNRSIRKVSTWGIYMGKGNSLTSILPDELWICVELSSGLQGWVHVKDLAEWEEYRGRSIFFVRP